MSGEHTPGRFGAFGGRYVPEALVPALEELDEARQKAAVDPDFLAELDRLHRTYSGRPSIITEVPRFAGHAGGARIFSSARTSTTPARTRSTTCSARPC
jgi:tryptophan synthase beta chain